MSPTTLLAFSWIGLSLLLAFPVGAQPEPVKPGTEEEAAVLEREEAVARLKAELAEREQAVVKLKEALAEAHRRLEKSEGRTVRVFPRTPALEAAGEELKMLEKMPEVAVAPIRDQVIVWGPEAAVAAVTQLVAAIDPTLQPRPITLTVRVYLAAEQLIPNFAVPPAEDPLVDQVRERTGYEQVALLTVKTLPGLDGEALSLESEMGIEGDWGKLSGKLRLAVRPQVGKGGQVQLQVQSGLEIFLGPAGFRRFLYESTLRTPAGQPALLVSEDPVLHSALVLALTPAVGA